MSDLKHNYLQDGFFAKSRAEELPVPGLTFTFVVRIDDVTARVEALARQKKYDQHTRQSAGVLAGLSEKLLKTSALAKTPGVSARIVPFFGGNRYYMFFEQRYDDVRLVVNPPSRSRNSASTKTTGSGRVTMPTSPSSASTPMPKAVRHVMPIERALRREKWCHRAFAVLNRATTP